MQFTSDGGVVTEAPEDLFGLNNGSGRGNVHHLSTMSSKEGSPSLKKQHSQSVPASMNKLGSMSLDGATMKRVESWSVMEEGGVVVDVTPLTDEMDDVLAEAPAPKAPAAKQAPKPTPAAINNEPGDEYAFLG